MAALTFRRHAIIIFAVLGAISGGVSALAWPLLVFPAVFKGIPPQQTITMSPGVVFAVALAIGICLTATRRVVPIVSIMAASIFGWWIVIEFAAHPLFLNNGALVTFIHWFNCGLVGALIVGVTGALAGLYAGNLRNLAEIGLVGGITGLLVMFPQTYYWHLFIVWQTAVGAAIGHAIVRSARSAPPELPAPTTPA